MTAKPTKVYPIAGRYLSDVPHVEHTTETKAEADALMETGAFTDNPNHPDRLHGPEAQPADATPVPEPEPDPATIVHGPVQPDFTPDTVTEEV